MANGANYNLEKKLNEICMSNVRNTKKKLYAPIWRLKFQKISGWSRMRFEYILHFFSLFFPEEFIS